MAVIMIVDDEEELRSLLKSLFENQGFEVTSASSGNKAIQLANKKEFDAILSDVRMHDGDGISLLKEIKKNPRFPAVFYFMSGYSDISPDTVKALGVCGIFQKPFDFPKMLEALKRSIAESINLQAN